MKLDRTKYFIRGNEKYPELIRQFFKGYEYEKDVFAYTTKKIYFINTENNVDCGFECQGNKTELKLTDLAIKNDLGEEYAPKMKEFFEKLGAIIEFENRDFDTDYYYKVHEETNKVVLVDFYTFKGVSILLSDWLGVEVPKEKTESLTAFETEVLEKTKRRTFKIDDKGQDIKEMYAVKISNAEYDKLLAFQTKPDMKLIFKDKVMSDSEFVRILENIELKGEINKGVESDNFKYVVKLRLQDFEKVYKNNNDFLIDKESENYWRIIDKETNLLYIAFNPSEFRSIEYLKQ